MIIGLVGSRRRDSWDDFIAAEKVFRKVYSPGDRLVSGACPKGGDKFAEVIAIMLVRPGHYEERDLLMMIPLERHHLIKELGAPIIIHPARWTQFGKGAGFLRNSSIANDSDILLALVAKDRTGGTEDTIKKFIARGKHAEDLHLIP